MEGSLEVVKTVKAEDSLALRGINQFGVKLIAFEAFHGGDQLAWSNGPVSDPGQDSGLGYVSPRPPPSPEPTVFPTGSCFHPHQPGMQLPQSQHDCPAPFGCPTSTSPGSLSPPALCDRPPLAVS